MEFFLHFLTWIFILKLVSGDITDKCALRVNVGSWESSGIVTTTDTSVTATPEGSGETWRTEDDNSNKQVKILNELGNLAEIKRGSVRIIFLIDESGSMKPRAKTLITKFNELLAKQNTNSTQIPSMTFVKFYGKLDVHAYDSIKHAKPLTKDTYDPNGKTALYDALGCAINAYNDESNNIVMIITDGKDTASAVFTKDTVKPSVNDIISKKKWIIQYYGANQNSKKVSKKLGIRRKAAFNWNSHSNKGMRKMMKTGSRKLNRAMQIQWNRIDKKNGKTDHASKKVHKPKKHHCRRHKVWNGKKCVRKRKCRGKKCTEFNLFA